MNSKYECVSEQGRSGILWTVFDGAPFSSNRIASFARAEDAMQWIAAAQSHTTMMNALEDIIGWCGDNAQILPLRITEQAKTALAKARGETEEAQ